MPDSSGTSDQGPDFSGSACGAQAVTRANERLRRAVSIRRMGALYSQFAFKPSGSVLAQLSQTLQIADAGRMDGF